MIELFGFTDTNFLNFSATSSGSSFARSLHPTPMIRCLRDFSFWICSIAPLVFYLPSPSTVILSSLFLYIHLGSKNFPCESTMTSIGRFCASFWCFTGQIYIWLLNVGREYFISVCCRDKALYVGILTVLFHRRTFSHFTVFLFFFVFLWMFFHSFDFVFYLFFLFFLSSVFLLILNLFQPNG